MSNTLVQQHEARIDSLADNVASLTEAMEAEKQSRIKTQSLLQWPEAKKFWGISELASMEKHVKDCEKSILQLNAKINSLTLEFYDNSKLANQARAWKGEIEGRKVNVGKVEFFQPKKTADATPNNAKLANLDHAIEELREEIDVVKINSAKKLTKRNAKLLNKLSEELSDLEQQRLESKDESNRRLKQLYVSFMEMRVYNAAIGPPKTIVSRNKSMLHTFGKLYHKLGYDVEIRRKVGEYQELAPPEKNRWIVTYLKREPNRAKVERNILIREMAKKGLVVNEVHQPEWLGNFIREYINGAGGVNWPAKREYHELIQLILDINPNADMYYLKAAVKAYNNGKGVKKNVYVME